MNTNGEITKTSSGTSGVDKGVLDEKEVRKERPSQEGIVWIATLGFFIVSTILLSVFTVSGENSSARWAFEFLITLIAVVSSVFILGPLVEKYREFRPSEVLPPEILKKYVESIFNSEEFLSALNSSIPKGEDDELYGFDYVPFMLQELNIRRERALKRTQFFLTLTILTGVFASLVLVGATYILLNEHSVGVPKTVFELQQTTSSLRDEIQSLSVPDQNKLYKEVQGYINQIGGLLPELKNAETAREINKLFADFLMASEKEQITAVQLLSANLLKSRDKVVKEEGEDSVVVGAIDKATNAIQNFFDNRNSALNLIPTRLDEIDQTTRAVNDYLQKPESRVAETLKRLFLGLVLTTFFLALLRYLGKLYREDRQEVIIADHDALTIRKFYVAYKCSSNPDGQNNVITAFMNGSHSNSTDDKNEIETALEDPKLLKEILNLLAKKI